MIFMQIERKIWFPQPLFGVFLSNKTLVVFFCWKNNKIPEFCEAGISWLITQPCWDREHTQQQQQNIHTQHQIEYFPSSSHQNGHLLFFWFNFFSQKVESKKNPRKASSVCGKSYFDFLRKYWDFGKKSHKFTNAKNWNWNSTKFFLSTCLLIWVHFVSHFETLSPLLFCPYFIDDVSVLFL